MSPHSTVHDLIGVWKKYALNTEKSIIPAEWESYWKEIGRKPTHSMLHSCHQNGEVAA